MTNKNSKPTYQRYILGLTSNPKAKITKDYLIRIDKIIPYAMSFGGVECDYTIGASLNKIPENELEQMLEEITKEISFHNNNFHRKIPNDRISDFNAVLVAWRNFRKHGLKTLLEEDLGIKGYKNICSNKTFETIPMPFPAYIDIAEGKIKKYTNDLISGRPLK